MHFKMNSGRSLTGHDVIVYSVKRNCETVLSQKDANEVFIKLATTEVLDAAALVGLLVELLCWGTSEYGPDWRAHQTPLAALARELDVDIAVAGEAAELRAENKKLRAALREMGGE